jgi:hypothetical protein
MLSHSEAKALAELLDAERAARQRYALALLLMATAKPNTEDAENARCGTERWHGKVERLSALMDTRLSELTAARQPLTTVGR